MVQNVGMSRATVANLSEMQIACLRLVAELKKTEQIAGELGISPSTVNTHIERAIVRLQVANRREAARLVVAHDAAHAIDKVTVTAAITGPASSTGDAGAAPTAAAATTRSRPEKQPTEELPLPPNVDPAPSLRPSTIGVGRQRNDLTVSQRLLLAVLALVLLCIGIAGLAAAIEQLSHWRASLAAPP